METRQLVVFQTDRRERGFGGNLVRRLGELLDDIHHKAKGTFPFPQQVRLKGSRLPETHGDARRKTSTAMKNMKNWKQIRCWPIEEWHKHTGMPPHGNSTWPWEKQVWIWTKYLDAVLSEKIKV